LAARPASPEHIDAKILILDLDVDLLSLRKNRHRRRGRVNTTLVFRRRHALHAVHARLPAHHAVGALANDFEDGLLDAAQNA